MVWEWGEEGVGLFFFVCGDVCFSCFLVGVYFRGFLFGL